MTPYLEIGGDYREVLPGIYLLELPLPFSLGLINVYLVRLDNGYLLIDCGIETDACFNALDSARAGLGVKWSDIRQILLTHIHPDHMGLAHRLLRLTGASLLLHHADARLLNEIVEKEKYRVWQDKVFEASGVPQKLIPQITKSLGSVQHNFRRLAPNTVLEGCERIPAEAGNLEVIWTPGHSPGHVCVYNRLHRVLFSGDHMLEHITPNIGWQPGRDALGEFLSSLDRIAQLEVNLVLPSHGAPFTGHREWVRKTREHHSERCDRILELLNGTAGTPHELVLKLWDRQLSPFHYRFALFEVLAHLEYLYRRGRVSDPFQPRLTTQSAQSQSGSSRIRT